MDITYLLFLQTLRETFGGIFDNFMLQITALGEGTITFFLLASIYWCVDKRIGQYMGFNVALQCTWNQFLKPLFHIERPWIRDERMHPVEAALSGAGGYSFPSGHTARAVAVWGAAGSGMWKKKAYRAAGILCWVIVAAVMFSRNYLGVHTPQDVLVSFVLGIGVLWVTAKALEMAERYPFGDFLVCGLGCLLCFLPMLKVGCLSNAGAGMGFMLGWLVERRLIRFEIKGSFSARMTRLIMGGLLLLLLWKATAPFLSLFMPSKYAGFFASFALAVYIMAVWPFLWCVWERCAAGVAGKRRRALVLAVGMVAAVLVASVIPLQVRRNAAKEQQTEQQQTEEAADNTGVVSDGAQAGESEAGQDKEPAEKAETGFQIIAHRGYSDVFPENTLAAFQGALDIGVDYIELDVQLTKDGQAVISHDDTLLRTTGLDARICDLTCDELEELDAGGWFDASFADERIPTLREALELIRDTDCHVYLELKDIGEIPGFEETILEIADACHMTERCLFASFQYRYLERMKELNPDVKILFNTTSGRTDLAEVFPAEYYGLSIETAGADTIEAIHRAGKRAFVWTANTPAQMKNMQAAGADGIVTNRPGLAKVVSRPEYEYLVENYERSVVMPGLYSVNLPEICADMVVQGFTKCGNVLLVSAYSKAEENSILYMTDLSGRLLRIVDLGFRAHTGGIAWDEEHDLLWVTGPEGMVYAVRYSSLLDDSYQGEILVSFEAGLTNHVGDKVASFLTYEEGELFVGSYVNGAEGRLHRYDLSDPANPAPLSSVMIPERIQGITFQRDMRTGERFMLLSQSYQTEDSHLLRFEYKEETEEYREPLESHVLPEGSEQIQMSAEGMYVLFESACRPYRETARIPNDQIYVIRQ